MKSFEVTCINKPNRDSQHEHITHIGNTVGNWRLTREAAIRRIDGGTEEYYTLDKQTGKKVLIGVVRETGKHPYLRTHADGKWTNNLLAQQECVANCAIVG